MSMKIGKIRRYQFTNYIKTFSFKNNTKTLRNALLNALNDVLYTAPLVDTIRAHSTDEAPKVSNTYL
jgi:hypothetical protein